MAKALRDMEKAAKVTAAAAVREQKAAKAKAITVSKAVKARANREARAKCFAENRVQGRTEEMIRDLDELEDISLDSDDSDKPGVQDDEGVRPTCPRPRPRPLYQRKNGHVPKDSDAALHSLEAPHSKPSQESVNMPSSPPPLAPISSSSHPQRTRQSKQRARNVPEKLAEMGKETGPGRVLRKQI